MTSMRIGFYVHYHGLGHKHRTEAILRHLKVPASVVTSRIDTLPWSGPTLSEVVGIACDNEQVHECGVQDAGRVPSLHYAPLWTDTLTRRTAQYSGWVDQTKPDLMVVDVSVEISMLTRLASIPQVIMRQHGVRNDHAHLNAYAAAQSLLAPFPALMEDDITPDWVQEKTVYLDGFCRTPEDEASQEIMFRRPTIVLLFGRGGRADVSHLLRSAAAAVPEFDWVVAGKSKDAGTSLPPNLRFLGWVENPSPYLKAANIVVTAAGHNSVMEVGRLRQPLIAIAEERPFDEQVRKVAVLNRERLAVGIRSWPDDTQWPSLIRQAQRLDTGRWNQVFREDGARQAAEHLTEIAAWSHEHRTSGRRISL